MDFVINQSVSFVQRREKPRPATIHQKLPDGSYRIRLGGRIRRAESYELRAAAEPQPESRP